MLLYLKAIAPTFIKKECFFFQNTLFSGKKKFLNKMNVYYGINKFNMGTF